MILVEEFVDHGQLLNQLKSPIYVKNAEHCWIYVNEAFCELLGHSKEFLLGKTDYDITPKDQSDIFKKKDIEVLTTKRTNTNIETTTNGSGDVVWVESKKSYFENANGDEFIFGVLTDITLLKTREFELEKARAKAESAELAKSQFLANMSHEVRTPMNGIMGMIELLGLCDLPPRQKDFVGVIQRSGNALLTIINDILDFSKIEAGQLLIDPAPFVLRDCIEDVMALLAPKVAESGIDLLLRIQPDLPSAYIGDAGRIRQILTNIIGNAVKFTHEGHVYINVSGDITDGQARLKISIEDTGIGIPASKLETIFDKFSQADTTTTREFGGTGLGLNIARELVRLMGGDIDVHSRDGEGSCFEFSLEFPCHADLTRPKRVDIAISGLKILVIDDNKTNRMILTEQLNHWGCKSIAAGSADQAMSVLNTAEEKGISFDLIVTDYQMPKKNGEQFIRMVKDDPALKHIPAIMLSSVDKSELKVHMTNLGVKSFLTKPTRASDLMNAIADAHYAGRTAETVATSSLSDTTEDEVAPSGRAKEKLQSLSENHVDVLIAEDNEVNQIYASYVMEELNLTYKIVPNGKIAVEKWKLLSPKIVLMDISMPEMNGYEATAEIRKLEAKIDRPRTPIIAATAHSLQGDEDVCLKNDMDGYLSKPIGLAGLTECLQAWGISGAQDQAVPVA